MHGMPPAYCIGRMPPLWPNSCYFLPDLSDLRAYEETTARRHRKISPDRLGFQAFDESAKQSLRQESRTLFRSQVRYIDILELRQSVEKNSTKAKTPTSLPVRFPLATIRNSSMAKKSSRRSQKAAGVRSKTPLSAGFISILPSRSGNPRMKNADRSDSWPCVTDRE